MALSYTPLYTIITIRLMQLFHSFFFQYSGAHRDLHSFPTRRSSDLPLRHEIELDFPGAIERIEHIGIGGARIRTDDLAHAPRLEQRRDADLAVAGIVVDDGQIPRPLRDQGVDQLLGYARAAEPADEDRRAVAHVCERGFDRRNDLVDHAGAQSARAKRISRLPVKSSTRPANCPGRMRLNPRPPECPRENALKSCAATAGTAWATARPSTIARAPRRWATTRATTRGNP